MATILIAAIVLIIIIIILVRKKKERYETGGGLIPRFRFDDGYKWSTKNNAEPRELSYSVDGYKNTIN